jgi:hypothetical protein
MTLGLVSLVSVLTAPEESCLACFGGFQVPRPQPSQQAALLLRMVLHPSEDAREHGNGLYLGAPTA